MRKLEKQKVKATRSSSKIFLSCMMLASLMCFEACKDDETAGRNDFLIVSQSPEKAGISSFYCGIEGGESVLYIFSNVAFESFFQTSDTDDQWVSILSSDYLADIDATRLTLKINPLRETLLKRTGTLTFVSKEHYLGQFLTFSQGFVTRLTEDFKWLVYGTANSSPYDTTEKLIGEWNDTQKNYGWNATFLMEKDSTAFCYGRYNHIKLGNDTIGGDLISPYFPIAVTKDTMLIVSFNAVAYTSESGLPDGNRLTVELLNGGVFSNGKTSTTLELPHIDHKAKNPVTDMWNNSTCNLLVKRTDDHPFTGDMKIRFVTGDNILTSGANRLFLDNINLYVVDRNSFYLADGNNPNIK
ncbi:MAG: hypothetical protein LBC40_08885 [Dysgonamonadaceae bacterium]|jgi:hypothetical protein|nr:hypothetical protein [Dysgonamonadaceae bacterium]